MYFPYLRARRFELYAIRSTIDVMLGTGNIIPIIEPVNSNFADLNRAIREFIDRGLTFILVTNPQGGQLTGVSGIQNIANNINGIQLNNYSNYFPAFIISSSTTLPEIQQFLNTYAQRNVALIHNTNFIDVSNLLALVGRYNNTTYNIFIHSRTTPHYRDQFQNSSRILIRDNFHIMRNADYPNQEFFTDQNLTYIADGYHGFGDFLIVGDVYREPGGPAHAVAIHLTYPYTTGELLIGHFISDDTIGTQNIGGKFLQALNKLEQFVSSGVYNFNFSNACGEFLNYHSGRHFPGLAKAKELSMRHHIELLGHIL